MEQLKQCRLCPRSCGADRTNGTGYCRAGSEVRAAKAFLHMWEEPGISGDNGSGTIFFSNCNLGCVYCQNYNISHEGYGREISIHRLAEIMLELQYKKANNINLVTPTPYILHIKEALVEAKKNGLAIPVIYNSGGYESVEVLQALQGYIDIYLPDIKYYDNKYGIKYSNAFDYFYYTSRAVKEMYRQVGAPVFEKGMLKKGLVIRHLMLPGMLFDSKKIIDWIVSEFPEEVYVSLMCQYTPMGEASKYPEINKRLNKKHYEVLLQYAIDNGLSNGFFQDFDSATSEYTPDFDLEGI